MSPVSEIEDYTEEEAIKYLKPIFQIAYPTDKLSFFKYKGEKYMVGQVDQKEKVGYDSYLISFNDKGEMKVVSTFYERGYFQYEDDQVGIVVGNNNATMEDKNSRFIQQLIFIEDLDSENPFKMFGFNQVNGINNNELLIKYMVSEYPNPNIVLSYLKNRQMTGIGFTINNLFGKTTKNYAVGENGYYEYKELPHGASRVKRTRVYGEQELKNRAENHGFLTTVPDELIELYRGNNEYINDMHSITDVYIKSTR